MSASATPRPFTAAMMAPILLAAASRAALTLGFVTVTPRLMRATSGMTVILLLDVTVIVWLAGSAAAGVAAAEVGPAWADSAATATMRAPRTPALAVRIDWDIAMLLRDRRENGGVAAETTPGDVWFPPGGDVEQRRRPSPGTAGLQRACVEPGPNRRVRGVSRRSPAADDRHTWPNRGG